MTSATATASNVKYSKPFTHRIGENSFQVSVLGGIQSRQRYAIAKSEKTGRYWVAEYSQSSWVGSNREGWSTSSIPTVSLIGTDHATGADAIQWLLLVVAAQN